MQPVPMPLITSCCGWRVVVKRTAAWLGKLVLGLYFIHLPWLCVLGLSLTCSQMSAGWPEGGQSSMMETGPRQVSSSK